MPSHNKLSAIPPKVIREDVREQFIAEAGAKEEARIKNNDLPWNEPRARNDLKVPFTVQLPETYLLKIKFLATQTGKSQQAILRNIITSEVDKILEDTLKVQ